MQCSADHEDKNSTCVWLWWLWWWARQKTEAREDLESTGRGHFLQWLDALQPAGSDQSQWVPNTPWGALAKRCRKTV